MSGAINELIDLFARLPGIGRRSATRLVFHLIDSDPRYINRLGEALSKFHGAIKKCSICANISDTDPCDICQDTQRDDSVICVVENIPDLWAVNSGGSFKGMFHVLHGLLAPLDGISPEDLNLDLLLHRVNKYKVKEVIVATRPSVEGEVTAMLIQQTLEKTEARITRIAQGVPHGSELEYIDARTLEHAFTGRRDM